MVILQPLHERQDGLRIGPSRKIDANAVSMSELGQKATSPNRTTMSASPPKTDVGPLSSAGLLSARSSRFGAISTYFARRKMVAATPPPDECGSVKRSSSPAMTNERLLFFPSQFGNVVRSI